MSAQRRRAAFYALEAIAFLLPALLPGLALRLVLCTAYYVGYARGAQYAYNAFKRRHLKNDGGMRDMVNVLDDAKPDVPEPKTHFQRVSERLCGAALARMASLKRARTDVALAAMPYIRYFILCYMFLQKYWSAVVGFVARRVPSHTWRIDYIHPESHAVLPLYRLSHMLCGPAKEEWAMCKMLPGGAYAICVWNQKTASYQSYLVNAAHLKAALGLADETILWAIGGAGLAHYLERYVWKQKDNAADIFDLAIDGEPAFPAVRPILRCLGLPRNVTAAHLSMWYKGQATRQNCCGVKRLVAPAPVVVSDMDLNDVVLTGDAFVGGSPD
jgi:hypothetical protein